MINSLSIEGFKSISKKVSLPLSPLTIFAGANNSGKSSIIQTLLLAAQTLRTQVHSRSMILNGYIVRLGTFQDIATKGDSTKPITLGFELSPNADPDFITPSGEDSFAFEDESVKDVFCEFSFSCVGRDDEREALQLHPRIDHVILETTAREVTVGEDGEDQYSYKKERTEIKRSLIPVSERAAQYKLNPNSLNRTIQSALGYEVVEPTRLVSRKLGRLGKVEVVGAQLQHFIPEMYAIVFDSAEQQANLIVDAFFPGQRLPSQIHRSNFSSDIPVEFKGFLLEKIVKSAEEMPDPGLERFTAAFKRLEGSFNAEHFRMCLQTLPMSVRHSLQVTFQEERSHLIKLARGGRPPQIVSAPQRPPTATQAGAALVQNYFSQSVKYLGPLRDEPKPIFPLSGSSDSRDVGFKGEHTAAVLEIHRNDVIEYIEPGNSFSGSDSRTADTLISATLRWLDYVGVANEVRTYDKGKLGHQLNVSTDPGGELHDLTHVGVGVSQILPILVLALIADSGSTLIFEQPELHLHPRVQTRLADFFHSMSLLGKQCIIETHSEYLINRLRYLAATDETGDVSRDVTIYFVNKKNTESEYRSIKINRYGGIDDWPDGFFDENERVSSEILKAASDRWTSEKKNG